MFSAIVTNFTINLNEKDFKQNNFTGYRIHKDA